MASEGQQSASSASLRILQFIESGGPGGAERVVVALSEALQTLGVNVQVLTFRTGWLTSKLDELKIKRTRIETVRRLDLALPFKIANLIRQERINLVHSHLLDSNFYGALASRIAGVPHLATEHGDVHHIKKKKFIGFKLRAIGLAGSSFVSVAKHTAQRMVQLGAPPDRILHCKNPLALNGAAHADRTAIRQALGIADDEWVWINVANLRRVKNQELLLKAFKQALFVDGRRQRLLFVGDGPEREPLGRLATELGIAEQVSFLGFRDDAGLLLQAADAFALSSFSEAMPMSVMEAVASGLPLVCTNVGGLPEVASEGVAQLVRSDSVEDFARALADTVSRGDELKAAAQIKAAAFQAAYSSVNVAGEYLAHYRTLIGQRRS